MAVSSPSSAPSGERSIPNQVDNSSTGLNGVSDNFYRLGDQLGTYLSSQGDRVQAGLRKILFGLGSILLALLVLTSLFLIGWVLFFYGATEALGQILGGRVWLAALIIGGSILLVASFASLVLWLKTNRRIKMARRKVAQAEEDLRKSFLQTESSVKKMASLDNLTVHYPLPMTGIALLAGFAVSGPLTGKPAKIKEGAEKVASPSPVFNRMQVWATLIDTGADILKDVLTPLLQEMLQPKKKEAPPTQSKK